MQEFGPHLVLDLNDCNPAILSDLTAVYDVLNELPDLINMHKITQPYVFPYSGLVPEDKGITGMVIIAESHISIHTFSEKNYAFIDVFSCKDFDFDFAADYLIKKFESKRPEKQVMIRGKEFPRSV